MSWINPTKYERDVPNINEKFLNELKGELSDHDAKITLAQFLRANLSFTVQLVTGGDVKLAPFQEILCKGVLNRNFSMFLLSRGASKCLDENSLVMIKDKGYQRLKNVNIGDYILANEQYQLVLDKLVNEIDDGLRVETLSGFSISGLLDHRCLTYNSDTLDFQYKKIKDLSINTDIIPIKFGQNNWGNENIINGFDFSKQDFNEKEISLENNKEIFYLMGIILGDGCIRSNSKNLCSIASEDKEVLEFCKSFYRKYLPNTKVSQIDNKINLNNLKHVTSKSSEIRLTNKIFIRFLEHVGFSTEFKAHQKIFPKKILQASKENVCSFLRGLFDTDGYASFRRNEKKNSNRLTIGLTSSCYDLTKTVQDVLLNLGISSSITKVHDEGKYEIMGKICNTKSAYSLQIGCRQSIELFNKYIGFGINRKQSLVDKYISGYIKKIDYNSELIPDIGNYLIKKYSKNHFVKNGYNIHKNISINRLRYILDNNLVDKDDIIKITKIIDSAFIYRKIKNIEKIKTKTVDIQVENEECYWSGGFINHNSYLAGQLCWMLPLFEPNTNILVAGPNFRAARNIFAYLEKTVNSRNATLLQQIFGQPSKRGDLFEWPVMSNNVCVSSIKAIPLNGEKIRGIRANVLILDEFLLLSPDIVKNVLMPFLVAPSNIKERIEVREIEDDLIKQGKMKEEDRLTFPNQSRMIALSSASYTFENLYKVYSEWMDNILNDSKPVGDAKYFIAQMGYKAIPEYMVDPVIIEEAKAGGEENPAFQREYCARFVDGSDSYFSAKKMHELTIKDGDRPTVLLSGDKDKKYILSIDPSWSSSPASDHFAMCILELSSDLESATVVHNYAVAGGELNQHIQYLMYILTYFNIVLIIADNADGNFIKAANESEIFKSKNMQLGFIDYDGDLTGQDYAEMLGKVKNQYNLLTKNICFKHVFNSSSIRRINEQLQNFINTKRIYFGSKLTAHSTEYDIAINLKLPSDVKGADNILTLISDQDDLVYQVKKQCSLIEVKSSASGNQTFDLPTSLKRNTSASRARKDNYTALMLGIEGFKAYWDINKQESKKVSRIFTPVMFGNSTLT